MELISATTKRVISIVSFQPEHMHIFKKSRRNLIRRKNLPEHIHGDANLAPRPGVWIGGSDHKSPTVPWSIAILNSVSERTFLAIRKKPSSRCFRFSGSSEVHRLLHQQKWCWYYLRIWQHRLLLLGYPLEVQLRQVLLVALFQASIFTDVVFAWRTMDEASSNSNWQTSYRDAYIYSNPSPTCVCSRRGDGQA